VPWAASEATSFVETPAAYRAALTAAGFTVTGERSRADAALDFFRAMQARIATQGRPVLGIHIMLGEDAAQKTANMLRNVELGTIAPTEIIARA